jgi:hypothetical protein
LGHGPRKDAPGGASDGKAILQNVHQMSVSHKE